MPSGALTPAPLPEGEGERRRLRSLLPRGEGGRRSRPDEGLGALDWPAIDRDLDAYGCAVAPKLISPETCRELQALYPEDARFRSRIVMAKHGFGKGEYKYFAYPLPEPIVALRRGLYARLAPLADRWNAAMGISVRYPAEHEAFLKRCHEAGQTRPTPLLLALRPRRLQLPAPGRLWRASFSVAGRDPALRAGPRLHRRRIRADRAAAAHAVARRGREPPPRRRGDLRRARAPRSGDARRPIASTCAMA